MMNRMADVFKYIAEANDSDDHNRVMDGKMFGRSMQSGKGCG